MIFLETLNVGFFLAFDACSVQMRLTESSSIFRYILKCFPELRRTRGANAPLGCEDCAGPDCDYRMQMRQMDHGCKSCAPLRAARPDMETFGAVASSIWPTFACNQSSSVMEFQNCVQYIRPREGRLLSDSVLISLIAISTFLLTIAIRPPAPFVRVGEKTTSKGCRGLLYPVTMRDPSSNSRFFKLDVLASSILSANLHVGQAFSYGIVPGRHIQPPATSYFSPDVS